MPGFGEPIFDYHDSDAAKASAWMPLNSDGSYPAILADALWTSIVNLCFCVQKSCVLIVKNILSSKGLTGGNAQTCSKMIRFSRSNIYAGRDL